MTRVASITAGFLAAFVLCVSPAAQGPEGIARSNERFTMRVVTSGLAAPWEVAYGPDRALWVTEREGNRVVRIDPADGSRAVLLTVPDVYRSVLQDGLLGLALHPDFSRTPAGDFVFLSFTYDEDPGTAVASRLAIRRYRYDATARALVDPVDVLRGLPAHDDHVGGRLVIGPDRKLYLTIGDQGSNFGQNRCRPNRAQELPTAVDVRDRNWTAYAGKVLRIDLDGAIPADNPIIGGVRSHVFSYGHRNPLGLAFGDNGRLYESEHGPETDDEVNLIEGGGNYGWPHVAGFRDNKTYVYANWSASSPQACTSLPARGATPPSVPVQMETAWSHAQFTPPIRTFFTFDDAAAARQAGGGTIAPGGLGAYDGRGIQGWGRSLLVLSLLKGVVYRVPLSDDGRTAQGAPAQIFKTTNRYRDIAIGPDQQVFYLATDITGRTADDAGAPTQALANPGSILEFTYAGS
jgi:PQQ-dependent dehydrogenase (s-GDH family)